MSILKRIKENIAINSNLTEEYLNIVILYKLSQVGTNMRARIRYVDGSFIPVNIYGLALADSGRGKGRIMNMMSPYFKPFEKEFMNNYAPDKVAENLQHRIEQYAVKKGIEPNEAEAEIMKHWRRLPKHLYSFSDATIEGVKAFREKLTIANMGSVNMEIDEIASNMDRVADIFGLYLECYDMGLAKQKLIKVDSNSDSGAVEHNLLMYGTPARLLNGSKLEDQFFDMLREGYGRRLLYAFDDNQNTVIQDTESRYEKLINTSTVETADDIGIEIKEYCNTSSSNVDIDIEKEEVLIIMDYENRCLEKANKLSELKDIEKAELSHRYWRALKIAGLLAYFEPEKKITKELIEEAIKIVELSGEAFNKIMNREPNYKRLFNFLVDINKKVTQSELVENLYFYNTSNKSTKDEMINLAKSYAYDAGGVVKETARDGVQFLSAEMLKKTNTNEVFLSVSNDLAYDYEPKVGEWDNMHKVLSSGLEWTVHHFEDKHRTSDKVIKGFNLLVIDVDDGVQLALAQSLMSNYKYVCHHTKRSTPESNRFRMVFLLDKTLELDEDDYKQFMSNFFDFLPFEVDKQASDISRKWSTVTGCDVFYNEGELINALDFLPETSRSETMKNKILDMSNLSALERYFMLNASDGNRNHMMIRFALTLVDGGLEYQEIEEKIFELNDKISNGLPEREIRQTVLRTVIKKLEER